MSDSATTSAIDDEQLQVVFLLDITSSMQKELDGIKATIGLFFQNMETEGSAGIHVWTFTEDQESCFISKSPVASSETLVKYVQNIQLCHPPDNPAVYANGEDGPENVLAATAALKESFTEGTQILCFIITDNEPHLKSNYNGDMYLNERKWLRKKGFQTVDAYEILNELVSRFKITFVPILGQKGEQCHWFHQAANTTNGLVLAMPPENTDYSIQMFTDGLLEILARMPGFRTKNPAIEVDPENSVDKLRAFKIIQLDKQFLKLDKDDAKLKPREIKYVLKRVEFQAVFEEFIQLSTEKFSGKRSTKRSRIADENILFTSGHIIIQIFQYVVKKNFDENMIKANFLFLLKQLHTLEKLNKGNPLAYPYGLEISRIGELEKNWKVHAESIRSCMVALKNEDSLLKCIYSLYTIADTLAEGDGSNYVNKLKDILYCKGIDIRFSEGKNEEIDFYDSWNLSFKGLEYSDVLQVSSAIQLFNSDKIIFYDEYHDKEYYEEIDLSDICFKDSITSTKRNAFFLIAHPDDPLASAIYHLLTSFPMLAGYIQSNLVSGGERIFPSLLIGIQSSALCCLLNRVAFACTKSGVETATIKQFKVLRWNMIRMLKWSILQNADHKLLRYIADIVREVKGFRASDPIPKIVAGVLLYLTKELECTAILPHLFAEICGEFASKIEVARESKCNPFPSAKEICQVLLSNDANIDGFDYMNLIHPIERLIVGQTKIDFAGKRNKLEQFFSENISFKRIVNYFYLICDALEFDPTIENQEKLNLSFRDQLSKEEMIRIFVDSIVLGSRTERYADEGKGQNIWTRLECTELEAKLERFALRIVKQVYEPERKKWNNERIEKANSVMISKLLQIPVDSIETPVTMETVDVIDEELSKISSSVEDEVFKLERSDFSKIYEELTKLNDEKRLAIMLPALCIGTKWTSEPPNVLRKYKPAIENKLSSRSIDESIKSECLKKIRAQSICMRVKRAVKKDKTVICNRHGHHSENTYPGLDRWTQQYEDERINCFSEWLTANPRNNAMIYMKANLNRMKEFSKLSSEYRSRMESFGDVRLAIGECLLTLNITTESIAKLQKTLDEVEAAVWIDEKFPKLTEEIRKSDILNSTTIRALRRRVKRCRDEHAAITDVNSCFCQTINI